MLNIDKALEAHPELTREDIEAYDALLTKYCGDMIAKQRGEIDYIIPREIRDEGGLWLRFVLDYPNLDTELTLKANGEALLDRLEDYDEGVKRILVRNFATPCDFLFVCIQTEDGVLMKAGRILLDAVRTIKKREDEVLDETVRQRLEDESYDDQIETKMRDWLNGYDDPETDMLWYLSRQNTPVPEGGWLAHYAEIYKDWARKNRVTRQTDPYGYIDARSINFADCPELYELLVIATKENDLLDARWEENYAAVVAVSVVFMEQHGATSEEASYFSQFVARDTAFDLYGEAFTAPTVEALSALPCAQHALTMLDRWHQKLKETGV